LNARQHFVLAAKVEQLRKSCNFHYT